MPSYFSVDPNNIASGPQLMGNQPTINAIAGPTQMPAPTPMQPSGPQF